ncbi:MAG TPA: GSU2403 family nucleotidyltransferase fold protein [Labilithrix sp.]|jgi:hypothetical protein|nr:GSU2403 family nucleotidyltransferase fold protein [Labilithrix sp.]
MARLFTAHLPSLQVAFSDLKRQAMEQPFLLAGTPGSVTKREVNGRPFFYRQYYDPSDKKSADYIGPVDDPSTVERVARIREQIEVANALLGVARMLSRGGYVRVDARTDAILAALANNGLFGAGAVLIGSHAYGALLNDLGARSAGYATEDIDVARDRALRLAEPKSFEAMLAESKLSLLPVPQLERKKPSTSFKPPGADRLRVDLLVPTAGDEVKVLEVRELQAHATALPYLRYLLSEPIDSVVLGRSAVVPVKVPRPERLAWHKMLVSELRHRTSDKKAKDVLQAAVLFAIVAEREPGALEEALDDLPRTARGKTKAAAKVVLARLQEAGHERAADRMVDILG